MANTGVSHSEAKAICDALECSPSANQASSSIYTGSRDNVEAKATQSGKASADKGAEKNMGQPRVPAVSKGSNKNKSISKAT